MKIGDINEINDKVSSHSGYGTQDVKDLFVWRVDPLVLKVSTNEN